MSRFVCEVRKANGTPFPPRTVRQLVLLLQMSLQNVGKKYRFLSDSQFSVIQNAVDNVMKKRAEEGLGLQTKKADVIDERKEEYLWASGILGSSTGPKMIDTLVFLIGLNYALRSGDEHRNLSRGQLKICYDQFGAECLVYTEKISKNNRRGLKDFAVKRKEVTCFANVDHPERCLVNIYKQYISVCPDLTDDQPFYLQPLKKPRPGKWFGSMPIGRNTLYKTVQRICQQAGFKGKY